MANESNDHMRVVERLMRQHGQKKKDFAEKIGFAMLSS